MSQSLPKYMLLDENCEEIRDKRVMPDVVYEQLGERATITKKKKISNTIPLGLKLGNSTSIFNIEYSSKYGLLLLAAEDAVVVKTTDDLEEDLIAQRQSAKGSMSISFSGELFLSPDEEILAICSESLMQFVKISNLDKPNNIQVPPIPNLNEANHYLWVDNTHFLCWKFLGNATLYTVDPKTLEVKGENELEMEEITGASVIHQQLFLISKMNIKIFEPLTGQPTVKCEIDMTDPNHDSPYFEYSYIIDVFKINIKEQKFTENDIFGFVVVFYDEDEDASDERFLTFARGSIFDRQSLQIRGYENFYSIKTSKQLFYNDEQQKLSFSVKRVISSGFICIMLQKSEKLYVVDPLEEFDRLNIYDIKSKHELKNAEGRFMQGMALMQNMLRIERSMPEKADEFMSEVVKKYNGEFMNLYFKDKETSLTIPFPTSIIAVGGELLYKRYAISSVDGIEDESNQQIFERLAKLKHSPHILEAGQCKRVGEKGSKSVEKIEERKEQRREEKKQEKKEPEKKEQVPKEEPKKEIKEEIKPASQPPKMTNIIANSASIFGKPADTTPKTGASLFGNPATDSKPLFPGIPSLFGKPEDTSTTAPAPTNVNPFTKSANPSGLFGGSAPPLFGRPSQQDNPPSAGLFSSQGPSLFAAPTKVNPPAQIKTGLFGNSSPSLFGGSTPALSLFDLMSKEKKEEKVIETTIVVSVPVDKKQEKLIVPAKEQKPSLFSFPSKKEEKIPEVQPKKEENNAPKLPSSPANLLFGGTFSSKPAQPALVPQVPKSTLASQGFFTNPAENNSLFNKVEQSIKKPAEPVKKEAPPLVGPPKVINEAPKPATTVPPPPPPAKKEQKPIEKPKQNEEKGNRSSVLNKIHNKLTNFMGWQKKNILQASQNPQYLAIKKDCEQEQSALRTIKSNFFGEDVQEIAKLVTNSTQNSQNLIVHLINHNEQSEQDLQKRLSDYQQVSNKMLYYVNLLGRKKAVNMRASISMSQSQIDKTQSNLQRVIRENQGKIEEMENESESIMRKIIGLGEKKKSSKVKTQRRGKKYNFQFDEDEEELENKKVKKSYIFANNNEEARMDFKHTVINLTNDQQPIIKLPKFEKKIVHPVKKAEPQPATKQTGVFGQPQQQKPKPKPAASPASFADKIPVKTEKVQVPLVPKVEPKKEEEKSAISQVYEQSISQDELIPPQAKRQISSIQQADLRGLKLPAQNKKKEEPSKKAPETELKLAPAPAAKAGLTVPQAAEGSMLFSQTTSIFDKSSASIGNSLFANTMPKKTETVAKPAENKSGGNLFAQPAAKPKEQKKEATNTQSSAPSNSLFSNPPFPATGNSLFGGKLNPVKTSTDSVTAPKIQQKPSATTQPKPAETKPVETKPVEMKKQEKKEEEKKEPSSLNSLFSGLAVKKDEKKPETSPFAPPKNNTSSPAFSAFNRISAPATGGGIFGGNNAQTSLFGNKQPDPPAKVEQPKQQPKEQPKPVEKAPIPEPTLPIAPPKTQTNPVAFTDAQAQSINNAASTAAPPFNTTNNSNNQQPQTTNTNTNQQNNAFMGTSFGNNAFNQPPPQFGGGNNRFMNSNANQPATTGFNPNAAKFGFATTNQKSFGSLGAEGGNLFQGNNNNQAQTNPLANQPNVFNNNQSATTSTNPFGGNTSMFNNAANNNPTGNNNGSTNPFNNAHNNNAFTNAFSNSNTNNNANTAPTNVFGTSTNKGFGNQTGNNTNQFGGNNSNNAFGGNNNNSNNNPFGGNNAFQSNSSSNLNNNNTNNMFSNPSNNNNPFGGNNNANNNSNFNMFGNNNNNNSNPSNNGNFLSKLNPNPSVTPPPAVNSHLMQMRK